MNRFGSLIRLRSEKYEEYKTLHAAVWPEVLAKITCCGIRNYSIYHKDGFLFSYFEYVGSFANPARPHSKRVRQANGGLTWRSFLTATEGKPRLV
jgi:L-rhamnose mutarotase